MTVSDTIAGRLVRLGKFDGPFWDVGLQWYNDPEIIALTSDDPTPLTKEQFVGLLNTDLEAPGSMVFGINDVSERPIGVGLLRSIDPVHGGCDLHITIGERDCWNRGYGAEAISLMRDYAFEILDMHKVVSTPFAHNARMIRCLEKCGFQQEGLLRHALKIGDAYTDVALMGVLNPSSSSAS